MRRGKSKSHPFPDALNRDGIRRNPKGRQGIFGPFLEFGSSTHPFAVYTKACHQNNHTLTAWALWRRHSCLPGLLQNASQVTDAYLLTLARRNHAIFVTFDTKLEGLADPETRIRVLT